SLIFTFLLPLNTTTLLLLPLNSNLYILLYSSATTNIACRSRTLSVTNAISLALAQQDQVLPQQRTASPQWISRAKSVGNKIHPCLTPVNSSNHSVLSSFAITLLSTLT